MSIIDVKVPSLGESVTEAMVSRWLKAEGEWVALDEILCELESDKASVEVPAEQAGCLVEILAQIGEPLQVGGLLCRLDPDAQPSSQPSAQAPSATRSPEPESSVSVGHPSPAAARLLREHALSPAEVQGSGRGGRITMADARQAVADSEKPAEIRVEKSATLSPEYPAAVKTPAVERSQHREALSPLRKTIARRLVAVKQETAMLTTFNEVDMHTVMSLRQTYKERFKQQHGVGLGFMSFFVAAACQALQAFPAVNAQLDHDQIVYHDYCDIGVAVSTDKGLVVPVLRNAERLRFEQIETDILNLAGRARAGKLSIADMSGGTFTITNGGVFGSMLSTPILNAPQCAILGMHNIVERPVAIQGEVVIRPIMYLALSYDHRLIDGKEAVGFLVRVKDLIEDPTRLLLGV